MPARGLQCQPGGSLLPGRSVQFSKEASPPSRPGPGVRVWVLRGGPAWVPRKLPSVLTNLGSVTDAEVSFRAHLIFGIQEGSPSWANPWICYSVGSPSVRPTSIHTGASWRTGLKICACQIPVSPPLGASTGSSNSGFCKNPRQGFQGRERTRDREAVRGPWVPRPGPALSLCVSSRIPRASMLCGWAAPLFLLMLQGGE